MDIHFSQIHHTHIHTITLNPMKSPPGNLPEFPDVFYPQRPTVLIVRPSQTSPHCVVLFIHSNKYSITTKNHGQVSEMQGQKCLSCPSGTLNLIGNAGIQTKTYSRHREICTTFDSTCGLLNQTGAFWRTSWL